MNSHQNALGQPIGFPVPDWNPPPPPPREPMHGRFCRLEPLSVERHADQLFAANSLDLDGRMWTYLAYGPFERVEDFREWLLSNASAADPLFYAIVDLSRESPVGVASYLRITPANGSVEVGHLAYSPLLQKTTAATEAMFLMMKTAFSLGYRRYEWACNSLNEGSRAAALRLGFTFEGVWRQARVTKGRNRDTAWFSMTDAEWTLIEPAFEAWLSPENFDVEGVQRASLSSLISQQRS